MFLCMYVVYINIYSFFHNFRRLVLCRNRNQIEIRSEFQTPPNAIGRRNCLRIVLTRSAPNARPIRPHSTTLWVPRRSIGAEGEERERVGRRWRCRKGCRSQGEHNNPLPPYQLTPSSPPIRLQQHGAL